MKTMLTIKPGWVLLMLAFMGLSLQTYADTEPNDNLATAENAAFGIAVSGSLNQAPVGDLDDYYIIVAPSDGDITVTVDIGVGLNAYIHIYDKTGAGNEQVYASGGSTVSVTKTCMAADTFAVRIDHYQNAGSYSFTTSITGSSLANDTEDNGSIANVTQFISEGQSVEGHIGYYDTDTGYDEHDYFGVILPEDGSYTFRAISDLGQQFYYHVKRKDGAELANVYAGNDTTFAVVNCLAADTVYLQVDRYQNCGGYTLSFENTTPAGVPIDTEDNGGIINVSQFISEGESVTGHIGYFDVDLGYDENDYFGVILPEDGAYTFRAIRAPGYGVLNFYLHAIRKDDTSVGSSYSYGDTTYVTVDCLAADTVYMRMDRYQGCGGYTLSFENTTPPVSANDTEDNGSIANVSQFISAGESVTGHIGYYDVDLGYDENDYFGVILPEDGAYTFRAIRDPGHGVQNFYLHAIRKDGVSVGSSYSYGDTTDLTVDCLAADTVYMRMDRYQGCGGYTLSFDAPSLTFNNDIGDNETLAAAALVPTSSVNEGHLGYYDVDTGTDGWDYYKFTVVQVPFELDIKIETAESLNAYVHLYNSAGSDIQTEYYTPGSHNFTRTITDAGEYYIALDHYQYCGSYSIGNFCANAPEVAITADGPTDICPGESVTLSATAGLNAYSWFKDGIEVATTQSYVATEPGTYWAAGYDVNGCDGISEEVEIGVFGVPEVSISTEDETTFCAGGGITLTATAGFDSYSWSNGASGQSIEVSESGNYTVTATTEDGCDEVSSNSIDVTVQVDSDGDGVCDVDDNCPSLPGEIGDACDDGDPNTENDMITSDCECEGTPVNTYDCPELEANIGDACDDGDASTENDTVNGDCDCEGTPIVSYDCPELEANIGDACDDGDPSTETDTVNDDCDCEGTPIVTYDCPELEANIGDSCDDGDASTETDTVNDDCDCEGTPIISYDCPELETNIGDACDDGDASTENDTVNDDCDCEGTPIITYDCPELEANIGDACDDGDASTENDTVNDDCDCEGTPIVSYDCPELEANIGDSCDDNNPNTINDTVNQDCECEGEAIQPGDCQDFVYYLADHVSGMGTDIYKVELSGSDASLSFIASTPDEVHIAYNSSDNLIYAVSKTNNAYSTLNPNIASPVFSAPVSLGGSYGQITGAVFFDDTKLLIASQDMDQIFSVNVLNGNVAVFDSNAPVLGGDIALRPDGMLYMATNAFGGGLYEVYPEGVLPDMFVASLSANNTGLAITDSDQLLLSQNGSMSLSVRNTDGSDAGSYDLMLNGAPFTGNYGDMASGCNTYNPPNPGECEDFSTFFAQFDESLNQTDIYSVNFSGSEAILTHLTSVPFEAHIGYDAADDKLYLVSKTGSFIQPYSPGGDSFMPDVNLSINLYSVTSAVFNPFDGQLYIGDANTDKVYAVDPASGAAVLYGSAPVYGGDLGLLEDGTLYLASQSGNALYDLSDSNNPSAVGSIPAIVTGITCSNTSMGFVISNYQSDVFTEISAADGSVIAAYSATLNGNPFTLMYGDMAAGCADASGGAATKDGLVSTGEDRVESALRAGSDTPSGKLTSAPNPSSGDSKVVFSIPTSGQTLVEVYDMNGRKVATLFNTVADANRQYTLDFDGSSLPNGVYIYRMTTDHESIIEKFMIAK